LPDTDFKFEWMKRTRDLLKKIVDMAGDDELCFRLHEISSLLEEVVGRNWDIYQNELVTWLIWLIGVVVGFMM
jgi:hypothetical protein